MAEWRAAIRRSLGVSAEPLVGMVARYHPVKGHPYFISSAASLVARRLPCMFVLVGPGCDGNNAELRRLLERHGLTERTLLLGERSDMEHVVNALDVLVCASVSESFPNAVGEAMACGVPCIVTDVGDCAYLVGDTGWVVPAADIGAMSAAMATAVDSVRAAESTRGARARERIHDHFSLGRIIEKYRDLYVEVLADRAPAP
jgi:glycosyltransferase involved in cell wall biosynthesis